jgi:hypothetical protein
MFKIKGLKNNMCGLVIGACLYPTFLPTPLSLSLSLSLSLVAVPTSLPRPVRVLVPSTNASIVSSGTHFILICFCFMRIENRIFCTLSCKCDYCFEFDMEPTYSCEMTPSHVFDPTVLFNFFF